MMIYLSVFDIIFQHQAAFAETYDFLPKNTNQSLIYYIKKIYSAEEPTTTIIQIIFLQQSLKYVQKIKATTSTSLPSYSLRLPWFQTLTTSCRIKPVRGL